PEFHVIVQEGSNGELYNLAIRGTNLGGSDGIDISGVNHWVHDVEVTNRDECVTVKTPASNFLIERIWCNQSGGSAMGSLSDGTAISNIYYRNVYTNGGNQMYMFKSYGGSGYVKNVLLQNFLGRGTAYGLDVNQYWSSQTPGTGPGVQFTNITFENWDGYVADGVARPPVQFICADATPCQQMVLKNVNMWSATNKAVVKCESAYGTGLCLKASGTASYAITTSSITQPAGYTVPPTLAGDLSAGFSTNSPIPIPTIPTTYYPGLGQISPLAKNMSCFRDNNYLEDNHYFEGDHHFEDKHNHYVSQAERNFWKHLLIDLSVHSKASTTTTANGATQSQYGQCGGIGYTGPTVCVSPYTCTYSNDYY
ncbi:hypothetical protein FRC00_011992, partial [Tulasnella sp. 408]